MKTIYSFESYRVSFRIGFLLVKMVSVAYKKAIMARPPMIMATGADLATAELPVCSTTGGRVVLGVVWLAVGAGTGATGLDCRVVGTGAGGASLAGGAGGALAGGAGGASLTGGAGAEGFGCSG